MIDVLIKDGYLITMDPERRELKRSDIAIDHGVISEVSDDIDERSNVTIDARGKAVLPGLVNSHTHMPMTLFRGYADDLPLDQWLEEKIWPLENNLTDDHVYSGALLGCLEMIKTGTTCFSDQYFFMNKVGEAVEKAGLRAVLSHGIIDVSGSDKMEDEIIKGTELVKNWEGASDNKISTMYGPHSPYTCSPECLEYIRDLSKRYGVGVHIHLSETQGEVEDIERRYGKRPVYHLDELDLLNSNTLAAHCVWLSEGEIELIKERGVKPVHNPVSNMKLGSGIAPVASMLSSNIPVALGTDGVASNNSLDMFEEMKFAALLQKIHGLDPTLIPAYSALEMATINGAKALGLDKDIGSIEVGKKADLIIINLNRPNLTPSHNIVSNIIYSGSGSDVDTTIINGEILMKDNKVQNLNESDIIEKARINSRDLISSLED